VLLLAAGTGRSSGWQRELLGAGYRYQEQQRVGHDRRRKGGQCRGQWLRRVAVVRWRRQRQRQRQRCWSQEEQQARKQGQKKSTVLGGLVAVPGVDGRRWWLRQR